MGHRIGVETRRRDRSHGRSSPETPGFVAQTVSELNTIVRRAPLQLALDVGRIVIHRIFGGLDAFREKGRNHPSYRELARHPELNLGPTALFRAVAVYEMCRRLSVRPETTRLGLSHLRELINLPESVQSQLLADAERDEWTVRRLQREVRTVRTRLSGKKGRPALPSVLKGARLIERTTAESLEVAASIRPEAALDARRTLVTARQRIDKAIHALDAAIQPETQ